MFYLRSTQIRVRGKGNKIGILPLASDTILLLDHYLRLERPKDLRSGAVRLAERTGPRCAQDTRRNAFPVPPAPRHQPKRPAHPHRFRHYAEFRTMPSKFLLMQQQHGMTGLPERNSFFGLGIVGRAVTGF